ncbi:hypothetical protein JL722_4554 [Aureococcus anophagefferens]|nr:hypothetical protein JL722_4554 [Aureococcus anophagefferens]
MAEPFERRHAAWGSVIGAQILAFACLAAQPWSATVRVLFMLSVSVAAARAHAMPFKSADTNYLQGALLTALPVFCALQLPWSVTSTINAPVGRDDKLPVIANRCAKCSLAILAALRVGRRDGLPAAPRLGRRGGAGRPRVEVAPAARAPPRADASEIRIN